MLRLGGNTPVLRRSESGKLNMGAPRMGTPMNSTTPDLAIPMSSARSSSMDEARTIQAGIQVEPGGRGQVE